jgi:hypothetical protein
MELFRRGLIYAKEVLTLHSSPVDSHYAVRPVWWSRAQAGPARAGGDQQFA